MFKMEKHIKRQDSNIQFNRNVPGCFWSIFHTIDYHPWHNVKKMLPYRRHSKSKGSPKSTMNSHHVAEATEQINDENKPLWCTAESCPIGSKPGEGYVNEVISKEISEEESQKYWKLNSNSKRSLSRTQSIHHLESSSYYSRHISPMELGAPGIKSNSLNAMDSENYFTQRKIDTQLTSFTEKSNGVRKTLESKQSHSFKEDVHIQEIFKANRKLFAELLQGAQSKKTLQTPQNKKSSASLAKSRSFPAPGLARKGYKKLSSLQHKQNESFPKVRKSGSPQPSKLAESESPKNFHEDVMPCDSDSTSSSNMTPQTSSSSLGPNRGIRHGGWNQLVVKRFNFIKQKIRHSFKERKKGNNQKTSKGTPTQTVDPSGHELPLRREEAQESLGTATSDDGLGIRGYSETGNSENDNLSDGVQTKTGTASLKAPLERYSQQPEREAKCFHSQSLRLIREETIPNIEKRRKSYGRNLSLPDIDLFCTLFTDPSPAVSRTEKPKRGVVHSSTDNNMRIDENPAHLLNEVISEPLDSDSQSVVEKSDDNMPVDYSCCLNEVKNDEGAAWADRLEEKIPHLDFSDGEHHQVLGSECVIEDVDVSETVDQVGETCFRDDETSKLSDSEGSILNRRCSVANELEPSDDQPKEARAEALSASETFVNHEIIDAEKISNYLHLNSDLGRINNADFNYMRYILQLSSFIESGHTIDRPLSSSIFEGEEAQFYKKLECYWEKVDKGSDHQLLHDLVYETSHNVFEKSFTSFLKTFSSRSQIRPMPLGQYLLEDVREKVSWYLCLGPELDQSLDDVVGRDLRKGDDWMNLQTEIEYNALELEDLILDELLEEVISF
ncbi:uncharacterized protein LOC111484426 isoform X2 [Cucurbita maxima]|uniref:Uncharacterized protein LOC111484426 isoform X2 n=1 Tax=Cucurbita maxima TaxID=3661 RepID=A0A6J1J8H7_CUCMA|nr:uncharacterized protein LOC111484426 isoform X2 [Cucurbita maxima]